MAAPKHAVEFDKIIDAGSSSEVMRTVAYELMLTNCTLGRERKKNEALAARIFNRDSGRRSSTPTRTSSPGAGSLASRVGVKKASTQTARPGNVKSDWVHDLHKSHDKTKQPAPNSLAARIHAPGTAAPKQPIQPRQNRAAKLVDAYSRSTSTAAALQVNQQQGQGMTIRGLAGPFTIMAQNFAPGTTAADIESAMTPIGGLITACRLIKAHPIVIAEIVFESKEGAERVIQTFNNQNVSVLLACGRIIGRTIRSLTCHCAGRWQDTSCISKACCCVSPNARCRAFRASLITQQRKSCGWLYGVR